MTMSICLLDTLPTYLFFDFHFFFFFAAALSDRLSFFMRASTETTREPLAAPLGVEVVLRTPDFDLEATT